MKNKQASLGITWGMVAATSVLGTVPLSAVSAEEPEELVARSWVLEGCPSVPITDARALLGAETLIGLGVDFVLDRLASALEEAAAADRDGRATAGTSAAYLYRYMPAKAAAGELEATSAAAYPQKCIVVALTASPPSKWCGDKSPFATKDSQFCTDESKNLFANAKHAPIPETLTGTKYPAFYVEIALLQSNDRRAVLPQIQALYYPSGVHTTGFGGGKFRGEKPRDVHVKVSASGAGGEPALGTVAVHMRDLVPRNALVLRTRDNTPKELNALDPLWVSIAAMPKEYAAPKEERYVFPINVASEVREVGKPNDFLQAIAKVFAAQKADLAKELKTKLVPGAEEAAEEAEAVAAETALATYEGLVAAAMKGEAEFRAACESAKPETVKLGEARQKFFETLSAQRKANATAEASKIPEAKRIKFTHDFGSKSSTAQSASSSAAICGLF